MIPLMRSADLGITVRSNDKRLMEFENRLLLFSILEKYTVVDFLSVSEFLLPIAFFLKLNMDFKI